MASGGRRGGAGERVLESRHVIGLFLLMLVFSGVFFTLGYVMGRNQYDGQVRAASNPRTLLPPPVAPNSDWSFYNAGKSYASEDKLRPTPALPRTVSAAAKSRGAKSASTAIPAGSYTLQVAAMRNQSDALALASHLQRKKFPAFVVSPQGDKYYRVQVGPFPDQKSADAAKKGLEGAGFRAIVKH